MSEFDQHIRNLAYEVYEVRRWVDEFAKDRWLQQKFDGATSWDQLRDLLSAIIPEHGGIAEQPVPDRDIFYVFNGSQQQVQDACPNGCDAKMLDRACAIVCRWEDYLTKHDLVRVMQAGPTGRAFQELYDRGLIPMLVHWLTWANGQDVTTEDQFEDAWSEAVSHICSYLYFTWSLDSIISQIRRQPLLYGKDLVAQAEYYKNYPPT